MFACLCSGLRAEGLVFWSQIHHLLFQQRGKKKIQKNPPNFGQAISFWKVARYQQGAVKSLVAKSSEDLDHMGCTLFQSIRRWAGFSPYVLLQALLPVPNSKQGTFSLRKITVFFLVHEEEMEGAASQKLKERKARKGGDWFQKLALRESGVERETVSMDSGDEDRMWTAEK